MGDRMSNDEESQPIRKMPSSPEAERAVLSCILMDGPRILTEAIMANLSPMSFFSAANGMIFAVLEDLMAESKPIAIATLAERLKSSKQLDRCGGYVYLSEIVSACATTAQARFFIEVVRDLAVRRNVYARAARLCESCLQTENDLADDVMRAAAGVMDPFNARTEERTWAQAIDTSEAHARERIKPPAERENKTMELSWGIPDFDRSFKPLEVGEMVVIGGWTSAGKTSLLRQVLWAIAKNGHAARIQTIETQDHEEATNLAAHISRTRSRANLHQLHVKEQDKLLRSFGEMRKVPFEVSHQGKSLDEIFARARAQKRKRGLRVLGIDYLQLLADLALQKGVREDSLIANATARCKRFATDEEIIVVLLSGFNGEYAKDGNRPPRLGDLHGSAAIAKDANRVLLIDIPKSYRLDGESKTQDPTSDPDDTPRFFANIIQAKGRNQGTSSVPMFFRREIKTFEQIDHTEGEEQVPPDFFERGP